MHADSQYLRERTVDFTDAGNRILAHLLQRKRARLSDMSEPAILVTHNAHAVRYPRPRPSSRARASRPTRAGRHPIPPSSRGQARFPPCSGSRTSAATCTTGDEVIVDGNRGTVIVNPDEATLRALRRAPPGMGAQEHHRSAGRGTSPRRPPTGSCSPSRGTSRYPRRRDRSSRTARTGSGCSAPSSCSSSPTAFRPKRSRWPPTRRC